MLDFKKNRAEKRRKKRKRKMSLTIGLLACIGVGIGGIYFYKIIKMREGTGEVNDTLQQSVEVESGDEQREEPTTEVEQKEEMTTENIAATFPTVMEIETTTTAIEPTTSNYDVIPASADYFVFEPDADSFFQNSVFVGDSVMMGYRNYCMNQEPEFLGEPEFLVLGSYSLRMALSPVSKDSIHPIYQGEQRRIWDSIAMTGAKRIFLCFGLNDLGMETVELATSNYIELITKIKEVNPDVEIFVISTTYMKAESQLEDLNNTNIRLLNDAVKEYCKTTQEAGFINIADFLIGEDGGLKEEYCSDNYVHQTNAAYEVWTKVLRAYASGWIVEIPEEILEETSPETVAQ